ncbi:MAG: hypothetical protein ACYCSQ_00080 [bacterium]
MKRNKFRAILYIIMAIASVVLSFILKTLHSKNAYYVLEETIAFLLSAIFLIAAGFAYSKNKDKDKDKELK